MLLRTRAYPLQFWLHLHKYHVDPKQLIPEKKKRTAGGFVIARHLTSVRIHLQQIVYVGAINNRKGEMRSTKIPVTSDQFNLISSLGATHRYDETIRLQQVLDLQYLFKYKGYERGIKNIQFRLQKRSCSVFTDKKLLFLRVRFHQSAPRLIQ